MAKKNNNAKGVKDPIGNLNSINVDQKNNVATQDESISTEFVLMAEAISRLRGGLDTASRFENNPKASYLLIGIEDMDNDKWAMRLSSNVFDSAPTTSRLFYGIQLLYNNLNNAEMNPNTHKAIKQTLELVALYLYVTVGKEKLEELTREFSYSKPGE